MKSRKKITDLRTTARAMSDLTRNAYWAKIRDAFTVSLQTCEKYTTSPYITYSLLQNRTITKNPASCGRVPRMIAQRLLARSPVRVATMSYVSYEDLIS